MEKGHIYLKFSFRCAVTILKEVVLTEVSPRRKEA